MEKIIFNNLLIFIFGAIIGYLSWSYSTEWMLYSSMLFFAYLVFPKRSMLAFFILGYGLVVARGLLGSVSYYYHSWSWAIFAWIFLTIITMLVYIGIWNKSFWKRIVLFPIMVLVLTLPPVGFFTAGNPLSAAGIVFPSYGYIGLILYLGIIIFISIGLHYFQYKKLGWASLILLIFIQTERWHFPQTYETKFQTTISQFIYTPRKMKQERKQKISKALLKKSNKFSINKILLYENVLGEFKKSDIEVWKSLDINKSVYLGAHIYDESRQIYDNALLKIKDGHYAVIYNQRIPMPISMWMPFSNKGARLNLFQNPIVEDENERLGVFICYEQMLVFPYLQTMLYKPSVLIGVSNLWWSIDKHWLNEQQIMMEAWGSLMNIPIYYSYNH